MKALGPLPAAAKAARAARMKEYALICIVAVVKDPKFEKNAVTGCVDYILESCVPKKHVYVLYVVETNVYEAVLRNGRSKAKGVTVRNA